MKSVKIKIKVSLILLLLIFSLTSYATKHVVTATITTNVNCMIGDTLMFYGSHASAWSIAINGNPIGGVVPTPNPPYYIGEYKVVGGENSFTIVNTSPSLNWSGTITLLFSSINEVVYNELSFNYFPNPTRNFIKVEGINDGQINVIDQFGRVVLSKKYINEVIVINLESLDSGIYIVELVSDDTRRGYGKILKN